MIVITILSVAAAGILSYSLTTYRILSDRPRSTRQRCWPTAKWRTSTSQWENLIFSKTVSSVGNRQSTYPLGGANGLQSNTLPFLTSVNANFPIG